MSRKDAETYIAMRTREARAERAPITIPCGYCDRPVPVASDHGQVVYCSPEHERSNRYTGGAL